MVIDIKNINLDCRFCKCIHDVITPGHLHNDINKSPYPKAIFFHKKLPLPLPPGIKGKQSPSVYINTLSRLPALSPFWNVFLIHRRQKAPASSQDLSISKMAAV